MDYQLAIGTKDRVTKESVAEFFRELSSRGFIDDASVEKMYVNSVVGNKEMALDPGSVRETISLIGEYGVKGLSVSIEYGNHYKVEGRPGGQPHIAMIMYDLNIASAEAAESLGDDLNIDFYFGISFRNVEYSGEEGEVTVCGMEFGGEGGYARDVSKAANAIHDSMMRICPKYPELYGLMEACFGTVRPELQFSEF